VEAKVVEAKVNLFLTEHTLWRKFFTSPFLFADLTLE
jgi:hypothetical protein